jgi:hypothetical protein
MSKQKKVTTGRMEERMWRTNQVARKEDVKPKKGNKYACRGNKAGRLNREEC